MLELYDFNRDPLCPGRNLLIQEPQLARRPRKSFDILRLPAERSEMLRDLESKHHQKTSTENTIRRIKRKIRLEINKDQPATSDSKTTISQNSRISLQTKPKRNKLKYNPKRRYDRE
jgi:hypothetical protein